MSNPILRAAFKPSNHKEEYMVRQFEEILERQNSTMFVVVVCCLLLGFLIGLSL